MAGKAEKKNNTRSRIITYVMNNRSTSKVELSKNLNMSMPTVLSNVNELMESGVLVETGEYASTGGRKAKSIGINPSYRYAAGIMITANHVGMVLVNMRSEDRACKNEVFSGDFLLPGVVFPGQRFSGRYGSS